MLNITIESEDPTQITLLINGKRYYYASDEIVNSKFKWLLSKNKGRALSYLRKEAELLNDRGDYDPNLHIELPEEILMRKEAKENAIEIMEDVRIPGTDIILEAGDKISIEPMETLKEATSMITSSLNDQYNREVQSALIYEQLANQAFYQGYFGAAAYFRHAAQEEFVHAQDFAGIIQDLEVTPRLMTETFEPIDVPTGFTEMIQAALLHEKEITAQIRQLMSASRSLEDFNTEKFLLAFSEEQVEEEAKYQDILARIESFGDNKTSLMLIDKELKEKAE